ncbi:hypothetical protein RUM43_002061 [Polyplax serrata]|uniref:Uncharacterized protein n=1 Tax=Polyplax serrata TaxID=468196 RepID=A0AAN8NYA9_POLSC
MSLSRRGDMVETHVRETLDLLEFQPSVSVVAIIRESTGRNFKEVRMRKRLDAREQVEEVQELGMYEVKDRYSLIFVCKNLSDV